MNNTFRIIINTENDAFEEQSGRELVRILEDCVTKLKYYTRPDGQLEDESRPIGWTLSAVNGNTVGRMTYTEETK